MSSSGDGDNPGFRAVLDEDRARWAGLDALHAQRVTLDQAREDVAKRTAMTSDLQPEKREPAVSELPTRWRERWHRSWQNGSALPDANTCAAELERSLAREPHLTLSADAVRSLAGHSDLERKCSRLEREVDAYRRALSLVISVRMMEEP